MFKEVRFPVDISFGASGGPGFATDVVTLANGVERRNMQALSARARYNVAHGVKTKAQLDELLAFFMARRGRAEGFRFKDWMDFKAINQPLGEGDGETLNFRLTKTYAHDGYVRPISKPVEGTVFVYVDSAPAEGVGIDYTTGVVTFAAPPEAGRQIHADFEFDVPVRFDTDQLSARMEDYGIYSWVDIPLVEIKA